jgi:hypothetical protein
MSHNYFSSYRLIQYYKNSIWATQNTSADRRLWILALKFVLKVKEIGCEFMDWIYVSEDMA